MHEFHSELAKLRSTSRWPDQEEFSFQVGMSLGGYRKLETGERIPTTETLQKILEKVGVARPAAARLMGLRDDAKASQVGIKRPLGDLQAIDSGGLAKRVASEVVFVLKQSGVVVEANVKGVMERRIVMILKSVLGA